jgi:O-antigen/teichoic acid export membrane protein
MSTAISEPTSVQEGPISQASPARPEPSLRANFSWTFSSNAFYAACQWGMLSVLAKAGNTAIVGQFALGLAITAPVFMFTNLQLRAVKTTDARSDFEFADYFTLRVLASLAGLLFVAAVAWLLPYDRGTRWVVFLVGVSKFVESLSDVIAGLLQKHERLDQVAISLFVRGALSIAGFAVAFLRTHSLVAAVVAMVLAWSAVFLFYDVERAVAALKPAHTFFRFSKTELSKLLSITVPLGVSSVLFSLNVNIPRYILVKYRGEAELGIFAAIAYTLVAVYLVAYPLGQSPSARLARMFADGDLVSFRRILYKLFSIGAAILVLGPVLAALFGRTALRLAYGEQYAQHVGLLVMMAVTSGLGALASFVMCGMTAARSFRAQAVIKSLTVLSTIGLGFALIPRQGSLGAALSLLVPEAVFLVAFMLSLLHTLANRMRDPSMGRHGTPR